MIMTKQFLKDRNAFHVLIAELNRHEGFYRIPLSFPCIAMYNVISQPYGKATAHIEYVYPSDFERD